MGYAERWWPARAIVKEALVEEKFEKYFGYLVRCEGKFCTTTLKI